MTIEEPDEIKEIVREERITNYATHLHPTAPTPHVASQSPQDHFRLLPNLHEAPSPRMLRKGKGRWKRTSHYQVSKYYHHQSICLYQNRAWYVQTQKRPQARSTPPSTSQRTLCAPITWFAIDLGHMGANSTRYGQFSSSRFKDPVAFQKAIHANPQLLADDSQFF